MARRWPVWALTALSLAILTAGVAATGGPAQGRAEKRDQLRESDLHRNYQTTCDPRLNAEQAVELAFELAQILHN